MSSYIIFCMDIRSIIEHEYPSMTPKNVSKEVARRWKLLNDDSKQLYKKKASQDRKQYMIEKLKTQTNYEIEDKEYKKEEEEKEEEKEKEEYKKEEKEEKKCNCSRISFIFVVIAIFITGLYK